MTEQLLNDPEVGTTIEKMGSKSMPEDVGMNFFLKAGFLGTFIKDFLYFPRWQPATVLIEENSVRFLPGQQGGAAMSEVVIKGVCCRLADEHHPFL